MNLQTLTHKPSQTSPEVYHHPKNMSKTNGKPIQLSPPKQLQTAPIYYVYSFFSQKTSKRITRKRLIAEQIMQFVFFCFSLFMLLIILHP